MKTDGIVLNPEIIEVMKSLQNGLASSICDRLDDISGILLDNRKSLNGISPDMLLSILGDLRNYTEVLYDLIPPIEIRHEEIE